MNNNYRLPVFSIILFLAAFTPFQKLLQTLLSPLGVVASYVLVSVESILFVLLLIFLVMKIRAGESLVHTPLDLPLALFAGAIIISIVINHQYTLGTFNTLRVLLRYVSLYYIVANLHLSERDIFRLQKIIITVGIFSGALAIVLFFVPSLNEMLLPRAIEFGDLSKRAAAVKAGAVTGTFSVPAEAASFLLLALIIFIVYARAKPGWYNRLGLRVMGPGLIIFGIFATYLRAAWLFVPVVFALFILFNRQMIKRNIFPLLLFCLALFLVIDLFSLIFGETSDLANVLSLSSAPVREYDYYNKGVELTNFLFQLVTPSYWQHIFTHQRGWTIMTVGEHMLTSGRIFGYGPDPVLVRQELGSQSLELSFVFRYGAYRDAYWIALMTSFGVVGVAIYFWIVYRVFRVSNWLNRDGRPRYQQLLGLAMTIYTVIFALYTIALPLPEIKAPSFFFWLFSGLVMNQYLQIKKTQQLIKDPLLNNA